MDYTDQQRFLPPQWFGKLVSVRFTDSIDGTYKLLDANVAGALFLRDGTSYFYPWQSIWNIVRL